MSRPLAVATVLASTALLISGCASGGRPATSLPGLTSAKIAKLETLAQAGASGEGDPHPSSASVFAATWHQAIRATGGFVNINGVPDTPVYVLVVRGHFHCAGCSPDGSAPWRGEILAWVLGRKTLRVLDGGGGLDHIDTSALGPAETLTLRQTR